MIYSDKIILSNYASLLYILLNILCQNYDIIIINIFIKGGISISFYNGDMPKNFVCLDLTMWDSVKYWKQDFRYQQRKEHLQKMLYTIHKEIVAEKDNIHRWNNGEKGILKNWWFTACISDMSLSDNKKENDKTKSELGMSKTSRLANWHIHIIFYSPVGDTENLLHVANTYREKWVKKYGIGGECNNNAMMCDIGKWYYASCQTATKMSYDSNKGHLYVDVWNDMIEQEKEKLAPGDREYLENQIIKWNARQAECIDVIKSNIHIKNKTTLSFTKVFSEIYKELGMRKALEAFESIGFYGNVDIDTLTSCFSGLMLPIQWINNDITLRCIYNIDLHENNYADIVIREMLKRTPA